MKNRELIDTLRKLKEKEGWTLYELSRKLDIQVSTLERWFKTNRINRIYARYIKDKLSLPR
mgnify:CR=1 FL=1